LALIQIQPKSMKGDKPQNVGRKKKAVAKKTVMRKEKSKSPNDHPTETHPIVAQYLDDGAIKSVVGVDENGTCMGFPVTEIKNTLNQIARFSNARKGSVGKEELLDKLNAAFLVFSGMKPADSIEAMMITQMIAVNEMTLLMSEKALLTEQPNEYVEQNINRVTKLCKTYATLVEAFNKYRTKGQQKITVQHVNVNDGGQAIVGDVTGAG
jgi:hypothetical protein